jgi:hypothetical protein
MLLVKACDFINGKETGIPENKLIWTGDISSPGFRVIFGDFDSIGFHVYRHLDVYHYSDLVLVSSWSLN